MSVSFHALLAAYAGLQVPLPEIIGWLSGNDAAGTTGRVFSFASLSPQEGDYLIYYAAQDAASQSAALAPTTSGYSNPYLEAGADMSAGLWYKKLNAGENSITIYPSSSSNRKGFVVTLVRNLHGSYPIENLGVRTTGATGTPNPSAVATFHSNALIMAFGFIDDDNITGHTPPTGYTDAGWGTANGGAGATTSTVAAGKILSSPGTEDPGVWTTPGGDDAWTAFTVAFRWKGSPYWGEPVYMSERGSTPSGMSVTDLGSGFYNITQTTADGIPRFSGAKIPASNGSPIRIRVQIKRNSGVVGGSLDYGDHGEASFTSSLVTGQWVWIERIITPSNTNAWIDLRINNGANLDIGPMFVMPIGYRYYRWYITETRGTTTAECQASEFRLLQDGVAITGTPTMTQPGGFSGSAGENFTKIYDGIVSSGNKWCDTGFNARGFADLTWDFTTRKMANGYEWATANDVVNRDPRDWKLQGSNDNTNWIDLDVVSGHVASATRNAWEPSKAYTPAYAVV